MFRGLGLITSYSFSFNGATGTIQGSDGYSFDCNSRLPQILADSTYKANDLIYGMSEDWLHKHAEQCRNVVENRWNWDCISQTVVAPNVLSNAWAPLYPAIDDWILLKRGGGGATQPPATTTPPGGTSPPTTMQCAVVGKSPLAGQACCVGLVKDPFNVCNAPASIPGAEVCVGTWVCSVPNMWIYGGLGILALLMMKR